MRIPEKLAKSFRVTALGFAAALMVSADTRAQVPPPPLPQGPDHAAAAPAPAASKKSNSKRPVPRQSERASAARQRAREAVALDEQVQQQQWQAQQQVNLQNGWQYPGGYAYGTPPMWSYGGFASGGAVAPGYGMGYGPVYGPGAVGSTVTVTTGGFVPASTTGFYSGDKFRSNWGTSVNGGTYYPGVGVMPSNTPQPLPRK